MPELNDEDLAREIERARAIANICEAHGELDGRTAARSQQRALEKEAQRRRG